MKKMDKKPGKKDMMKTESMKDRNMKGKMDKDMKSMPKKGGCK